MSFEKLIQQWVLIDNQLKQLNEKIKELREERNALEENINSHVTNNNLSNATVKISDGKLKFINTRVPEPLTFKYLENSLKSLIKNENQIKVILEHIKQNRNIKLIPEIKRYYNK